MRLVHLAPASQDRSIRRTGIAGTRATLVATAGPTVALRSAVFAMPVVSDFWTTFQWLRELRRGHDQRMVAVYFRVSDDEIVHVGRYGQPHGAMTAAAAAAWVVKSPAGAEVVVPHRVAAKDVLAIRHVRQLVGWTEVPETSKKFDCVCPACLPRGDRSFMRRVRGSFAAGVAAVRSARSDEEIISALGRLEIPLERARGRIEPTKLLALARSRSPRVRQAAARLLGYFRWSQVQGALLGLLDDDAAKARLECVEALTRTAGIKRSAALLASASHDAIEHFVELIEYQVVGAAAIDALERFADHQAIPVRESVRRVAGALLAEFDGATQSRLRLESLSGLSWAS